MNNKRVFPINIAREQKTIDSINKYLQQENIVEAKKLTNGLLQKCKDGKYPDSLTVNTIEKFLKLLDRTQNNEEKNYKVIDKLNWEE